MTIAELIEKLKEFSPTAIVAVKSFGSRTEPFLEVDDLTQWQIIPSEDSFGLLISEAENQESAECVVFS